MTRPARRRRAAPALVGLAAAAALVAGPVAPVVAQEPVEVEPAPLPPPGAGPLPEPEVAADDEDSEDESGSGGRNSDDEREGDRERGRDRERTPDPPEPRAPAPEVAPPPAAPPPAAPSPTPPAAPDRPVPPTRAAGLLTPAAGARVATLRPVLAWRGLPGGSVMVNLQVFRVDGGRAVKVLSVFPRGNRARLPVGTLRSGERYVWRVWPYRGGAGGYTADALATSWFDVVAPPRIVLSAGQLRINQRIAQAAVRRANAVQGWLDEGLQAGDLRDGSLAANAFDASVRVRGEGAPAPGAASPRPLAVARRAAGGAGAPVRLSPAQLLVNQRISQAAIRRLNALQGRLDAGLGAADVRAGAVTAQKLAPGLRIGRVDDVDPPAGGVAPAPAAGAARSGASVTMSAAQLRVNQRIAQAAVRRASALEARLAAGLTGADLAPGSLTGFHLESGLGRRP